MGDHLRRHRWSGGTIYGSHTWSGGTIHSNIFCRRWSGDLYFGGTICGMTDHATSLSSNFLYISATHGDIVAKFCAVLWHIAMHACEGSVAKPSDRRNFSLNFPKFLKISNFSSRKFSARCTVISRF